MSDTPTRDDSTQAPPLEGEGQTRRAFVRRAALIGVPVVLASIPSRTVWARPKAGKQGAVGALGGPAADTTIPSATHSSTLGNVNLFPHV
jgi:hypothetical protein